MAIFFKELSHDGLDVIEVFIFSSQTFESDFREEGLNAAPWNYGIENVVTSPFCALRGGPRRSERGVNWFLEQLSSNFFLFYKLRATF